MLSFVIVAVTCDMCMRISMCLYIHTHVHAMYISIYSLLLPVVSSAYVYACAHMHTLTHAHTHIWTYTLTHTHTHTQHTCMYTHYSSMSSYTHMHTHPLHVRVPSDRPSLREQFAVACSLWCKPWPNTVRDRNSASGENECAHACMHLCMHPLRMNVYPCAHTCMHLCCHAHTYKHISDSSTGHHAEAVGAWHRWSKRGCWGAPECHVGHCWSRADGQRTPKELYGGGDIAGKDCLAVDQGERRAK